WGAVALFGQKKCVGGRRKGRLGHARGDSGLARWVCFWEWSVVVVCGFLREERRGVARMGQTGHVGVWGCRRVGEDRVEKKMPGVASVASGSGLRVQGSVKMGNQRGRSWMGERSRHGERSARRRQRCRAFDPPIVGP